MFKKAYKQVFGDSDVEALKDMGFDEELARQALSASDGNLERATEFLLSHQEVMMSPDVAVTPSNEPNNSSSDGQSNGGGQRQVQSAAARRAGEAALERERRAAASVISKKNSTKQQQRGRESKATFIPNRSDTIVNETSKANSHPKVKLPTQMKDKTKEDQILRCTQRLAPHPEAVDTLLRAFTLIQQNPNNAKYRRVDKSTPGFKRTLQDKPGAHDLLLAMNFMQLTGSERHILVMDRNSYDYALLYLAISALENAKESKEYITAKANIVFQKEIKSLNLSKGNEIADAEEAIKRAAYISKCPSEPLSGAGALMQLNLGDEKIMRRFDGDDVLRDVIHWVGGHGSIIPDKIASREWSLVDLNKYPITPIDTEQLMGRTLQFIGCWPSGRLEIRPSTAEWKEQKVSSVDMP